MIFLNCHSDFFYFFGKLVTDRQPTTYHACLLSRLHSEFLICRNDLVKIDGAGESMSVRAENMIIFVLPMTNHHTSNQHNITSDKSSN